MPTMGGDFPAASLSIDPLATSSLGPGVVTSRVDGSVLQSHHDH